MAVRKNHTKEEKSLQYLLWRASGERRLKIVAVSLPTHISYAKETGRGRREKSLQYYSNLFVVVAMYVDF